MTKFDAISANHVLWGSDSLYPGEQLIVPSLWVTITSLSYSSLCFPSTGITQVLPYPVFYVCEEDQTQILMLVQQGHCQLGHLCRHACWILTVLIFVFEIPCRLLFKYFFYLLKTAFVEYKCFTELLWNGIASNLTMEASKSLNTNNIHHHPRWR